MENKKKVLAVSLGGAVLVGAGVYWYMHSNEKIDTPSTDEIIEPGYASNETADVSEGTSSLLDTENVGTQEEEDTGILEEEIVELSESELYKLFEGVYLESVYAMRNHLQASKSILMALEYDRIEDACPIEKLLPTDYKEQYKVWRENYRIEDMSLIFTDEEAKQYYVKESSYTYTNIYDEAKVESLIVNELVLVTGIGYDKGEGWLRVETSTGVGYVEADKLAEKKGDGFFKVSKTMYAIEAVNIRVAPNGEAEKVDTLAVGESVYVIGIGQWDVTGWSKIKIGDNVYYVRSEYLSDEKPVTNNNSGSNTSGSNQSNNGGNSGGNQSGGNSGSNNGGNSGGNSGDSGNTGGNSGNTSEGGDDEAYFPGMYRPPEYDEETQEAIDRENREDSDLVRGGD